MSKGSSKDIAAFDYVYRTFLVLSATNVGVSVLLELWCVPQIGKCKPWFIPFPLVTKL